MFSRSVSRLGRDRYHSSASVTDNRVVSMMFLVPTVTATDSGRSRIPPQVGQGRVVMYRSISCRVASDPVSR